MKKHLLRIFFIAGLTCALVPRVDGQAAPVSTVDVVFIGDSITAGAGTTDRATEAAPVIATQELQKQLGGTVAVYMSNQGKSGFTTVNFLPEGATLPGVEGAAKDLETSHAGQLVFSIMLGTNDSANSGPKGSPVSGDDYGHNLKQMIDKLLADFPESKIVINHPIWYSPNTHNGDPVKHTGSDYEGDSAANRLKSYFPAIEALVTDYAGSHPNHVYLGDTQAYDYLASHTEEFKPENGQKGVFYLHPNAKGAQSLGGFWATAIAKSLNP